MGLLKNGEWIGETPGFTSGVIYLKHHGLSSTPINNWITKDGSAGPSGKAGFKAESGRYHLYHSPGCPFSHRAMEILKIKDLEEHISVSIVSPDMYNNIGWKFDKEDMSTGDHLFQEEFLRDIYVRHDSNYTGEVSVPLLWDKRDNTAVSKESNDIFKMLNSAFNDITGNSEDYVNATSDDPECSEEKFGFLCKWIFEDFCFNIYKVGYHPSDQGYQEACLHFFEQMDKLEEILSNRINSGQQFIFGDKDRSLPTLADFYLFNVLIRFDVAYYFLYKCNLKRVQDYPNIFKWLKCVYNFKNVGKDTVDFNHIKEMYYRNALQNPGKRVPLGPILPNYENGELE